MNEKETGNLKWEDIYKELPKPQLHFFCQIQSDANCLTWIKCSDEVIRSLTYLWLSDLIVLEMEIRRAVAEAKSLKGISFSNHPGARHQPFRYHADNACYHIFSGMDKVGQFLNTYLSLKVDRADFKKVIKTLLQKPELKDIPELLFFIEVNSASWYESISEYRHSLSHRLSPACETQESYIKFLKDLSSWLEFRPIKYSVEELDNLISHGHKNIVIIIERCEGLLNKFPCRQI